MLDCHESNVINLVLKQKYFFGVEYDLNMLKGCVRPLRKSLSVRPDEGHGVSNEMLFHRSL